MKSHALHRILVCVDRSAYAKICLKQALAVADCLGGVITVLHVQPVIHERTGGAPSALEWELERQEATVYLEHLRDEMKGSSACDIQMRVEQGEPAGRIAAVARELGADLTVLGERGKGQSESSGLGSTAQQILAFARESVLVVRSSTGETPLKRILVPLDGSVRAESVLPVAQRIAIDHRAELLLAYAVAEPVPSAVLFEPADIAVARDLATRLESSGRRYLAGLQKQLSEDGATTRTIVLRDADVRSALVALSLAEHADLIVLSAHGVTCNPDLNRGSVAMSLSRRASAALLLLQDLHGPELHAAPESPSTPGGRASFEVDTRALA